MHIELDIENNVGKIAALCGLQSGRWRKKPFPYKKIKKLLGQPDIGVDVRDMVNSITKRT